MRFVLSALLLAAALTVPAPALQAQALPADAYLDAAARELVALARARRAVVDRRITAYETTARERMSAGLRVGAVERLLWRRETVSRIEWTQDTVRIELLGAREVLPPVRAAPQLPSGLAGSLPSLAFDPVDSELLLRVDSTFIRHPLSVGSEAHYRFSSGGSTVIRLADGRQVQLHELRVAPRRADASLINGSFWIDAESHGVVQAYFSLAGELRDDGGSRISVLAVPGPAGLIEYVSIDYGLWDMHWWLPRTVAARGVMQFAGMRIPLEFERRYDDYRVVGDTSAAALLAASDTTHGLPDRPCRPATSLTVAISTAEPTDSAVQAAWSRRAARDSVRAAQRSERLRAAGDTTAAAPEVCDRPYVITSAGRDALLNSELFDASIYSAAGALLSETEREELLARIRAIAPPPWHVQAPRVELLGPGLIRYNRVEGLSLGGRATMGFGRLDAALVARVGTTGEVGAELRAARGGSRLHGSVAAYRRLDVADVATAPFTPGSSLGTLLLGRDENDYFRATGIETRLTPLVTRPQWYDLRLFAERQTAVATESHFTLRRLGDAGRELRPNLTADAADQFGARLRLRTAHGLDPAAPRWAAELDLHGETGDFSFGRPALRVYSTLPLPLRLSLASELAGGTGLGDLPQQRLWQIGGAQTLRAYDPAVMRGDSYWRARAELGAGITAARIALFGDVGWAGGRAELGTGRPLRSVGAGLSLLDGLLRLDLAHALDGSRGWKLHAQTGGR
jgi:hypothetical protein